MVAGPVTVTVIFNITVTAPLLTAKTETSVPENNSTRVPDDLSTFFNRAPVPTITTNDVAFALLPTITTVPSNRPTNVAPAHDPTITTTVPANPPTLVVLEPYTTTTTCVYANPRTKKTRSLIQPPTLSMPNILLKITLYLI